MGSLRWVPRLGSCLNSSRTGIDQDRTVFSLMLAGLRAALLLRACVGYSQAAWRLAPVIPGSNPCRRASRMRVRTLHLARPRPRASYKTWNGTGKRNETKRNQVIMTCHVQRVWFRHGVELARSLVPRPHPQGEALSPFVGGVWARD